MKQTTRYFLSVCAAAILTSVNVKADLAVMPSNSAPLAHTALEETVSGYTTRRVTELAQDTRYPEAVVKEAFAYGIQDQHICANALKAFKTRVARDDEKAVEIYNAIHEAYNREMPKHLGLLLESKKGIFRDSSTMPEAPKFLARKVMSKENQLNSFLALFAHEFNKGAPDSIIDEAVGHTFDRVYALQEGVLLERTLVVPTDEKKKYTTDQWIEKVALDNEQALLQHKIETFKEKINNKRDFSEDKEEFLTLLDCIPKSEYIFGELHDVLLSALENGDIDDDIKDTILYKLIARLKTEPLAFYELYELALSLQKECKDDTRGSLLPPFLKFSIEDLLEKAKNEPWLLFKNSDQGARAGVCHSTLLGWPGLQDMFKTICEALLNSRSDQQELFDFLLQEAVDVCDKCQYLGNDMNATEKDLNRILEWVKVVSSKPLFPMIEGMNMFYGESDFEQGSYDEDNPDPTKLIEDIDFSQYEINEAMIQDPRIEAANKESDAKLDEVTHAEYETAKSDLLKRFRQLKTTGKITQDMLKDEDNLSGGEASLGMLLTMKELVGKDDLSNEMQNAVKKFKAKVVFVRNHIKNVIKDDDQVASILASLAVAGLSCSTRAQNEINGLYNSFTGRLYSKEGSALQERVAAWLADRRKLFMERIALETAVKWQIRTTPRLYSNDPYFIPGTEEYQAELDRLISKMAEPEHYKMYLLSRAARLTGLPGNYELMDAYDHARGEIRSLTDRRIIIKLKEKYTVEKLVESLHEEMLTHDAEEKSEKGKYSTLVSNALDEYKERENYKNDPQLITDMGYLTPALDGGIYLKTGFTKRSALSILMGLGYVKKKETT